MKDLETLEAGLAALNLPDAGSAEILDRFRREIEFWNPSHGLVAPGSPAVHHILDSLAGLAVIRSLTPRRLVDVGSGAGLPGIPLAVFLKETEFSLVERSGRRAGFLRNAVSALGLNNVTVIEADAKEVRETFDVMTFRAFAPLHGSLLEKLKPLLEPGGVIAAYKGRREKINRELSNIGTEFEVSVQPLITFGSVEERHMVFLRAAF